MKALVRTTLLAFLGLAAGAGSASAQEWGVSFQKTHRRGSIELGFDSRGGAFVGASYGRGSACAPAVRRARPVSHRVWIPGRWTRVWVSPVYRTVRRSCGTEVRVLVREGYWRRQWQPGYYESRGYLRR